MAAPLQYMGIKGHAQASLDISYEAVPIFRCTEGAGSGHAVVTNCTDIGPRKHSAGWTSLAADLVACCALSSSDEP